MQGVFEITPLAFSILVSSMGDLIEARTEVCNENFGLFFAGDFDNLESLDFTFGFSSFFKTVSSLPGLRLTVDFELEVWNSGLNLSDLT